MAPPATAVQSLSLEDRAVPMEENIFSNVDQVLHSFDFVRVFARQSDGEPMYEVVN